MSEAELPNGWSSRPLGTLVDQTLGGDWGKGEGESRDHTVRVAVVRGTEFRNWGTARALTAATRFLKARSAERRRLAVGDLVVEVSGGGPNQPVGRVVRIDEQALRSAAGPLVCSNFCRQVRLAPGVEPAFVENQLRWARLRGDLDAIQTQTTNLRNLDFGRFLELPIQLPPLAEQKRIVERIDALLAEVSTTRERLNRVREILKRFRQSVLAAACSGRLTEEWRDVAGPLESATVLVDTMRRARAPRGEAAAVPAGDSDGLPDSPLPGTWTWCRVGDIARVYLGGTPSRKIASYWGGDLPWVSSSEVANCRISTTRETITPAGRDNSNAKVYPPGTVLIAMIGEGKTRGQAAILDIAACTNQNSAGLVLEPATMSAEYVWYWALREYETHRSAGRGGNYPALNSAKVRALPIPVPPRGEQEEIVRRVGALFSVAEAIEDRVAVVMARAAALSQAILAKAFRGALIVAGAPAHLG